MPRRRSEPGRPDMILPTPVRQLYLHDKLVEARRTVLHEALLSALGLIDPDQLADEIKEFGPRAGRQALQAAGIRDDLIFATPGVLRARPSTLGYYRLLLGVSQKQFYRTDTGFGPFKSMEEKNLLSAAAAPRLPDLCRALNSALGELVTGLDGLTRQDIDQLPLLGLGAQFDGSWRNRIGQRATKDVFVTIVEIIKAAGIQYTEVENSLTLVNSSGRKVTVALAADPDVLITEEVGDGQAIIKVAIEIKGGTDQSNAHNRVGEAEKSHQKVKNDAQDFWTVISIKGIDMSVLRQESPTTKQWFDVTEVIQRSGRSWQSLQQYVRVAIGI